jgi:hypothetical protein
MQDHLTCNDKEKVVAVLEEELIENKLSLFDALQGLEVARNYIPQFDVENHILVTCCKIENKLYILKYQEKCKQITILDWLKKKMNFILF